MQAFIAAAAFVSQGKSIETHIIKTFFFRAAQKFMKCVVSGIKELPKSTVLHSGVSGQPDRVKQKACKSREDSL